ncbi:HD domain-containing phosphohydrolase [Bacillus cihuensis]|uniref:HD domain-containing phosphohydrolase n=1 Tax=Bacillus cihuensis TaxID=1208599 RepID=UPI0004288B69|nr:HD domain-containing phosphohydrolase [Bacillus cihuensis]
MKKTLQLPYQLQGFLELGDAVIITDSNHIILEVNDSYQSITGFERAKIIGLKAGFIKSNLTSKSTYISMKNSLKELIPWSGILINRKKSGELWHSSITITPFKIEKELFYIGIFRALEQLKEGLYLPENKKIEVQRELLKVLAISCEIRDPGTEEHLIRVQELTEILIKSHNKKNNLQLEPRYINNIIHSSILHDIGKAGMPEGILYKPGALTSSERKIIEMHPLIGADILNKMSKEINYDFIKSMEVAENIILYHHEKWDGTGYPFNLEGEKIPFEARIVSIVDVFDALTSRRPYKDSWSKQKALSYIDQNKGKHFDPLIAETFINLF